MTLTINRTRSFTWNSDGTLATLTDERGAVETYYWDGLHRLTGTSDSRGATTNLYYLLSGTPYPNSSGGTSILDRTAMKDRDGYWTYFVYDPLRRKTAETNANAVVTGYGYCKCGGLGYITNAWNTAIQQLTIFNYDYQGRLTIINFADGYNVTNWFDSLGRKTETGDGTGYRWLYYDNLNRLNTFSNAYGAELVASYDVMDRPVYITGANGVMITNTYDNLHRLFTRGYPDGGVEKFGYSARGLTAYTNQIGMTNFFAYDEAGRKTYETNANGEILKFTNNAAGDLLSLTDGKNQTTKWIYDQFGRVTNKLDQAGTVVLKYFYDADDRLTNRWSAAKGTTYYTNDPVGSLIAINYPSSTDVKLQYDALNRLTNMVDAAGTTKYTYTAGNQPVTEDGPFASDILTNAYVNRVRTSLSLQQPTGAWTNNFVYDAASRMTNVISPAGAFNYTYHPSRITLPIRILLPNTSYITNTWDSVARLTATYLKNSGNTILDSAGYGYNVANQRSTFTNAAGNYYQFTYDKIGQLTIADSSVNTEDRGYLYDSAWNLSSRTNNGVRSVFTVDSKNQLASDPSATTDTYDSNGNLTSRNVSGTQNYTYDDENRLTAVSLGTVYNTGFTYDALGRLRKRIDYTWNGSSWIPNTTTEYIYDGMRVIQERDVNNTPTVSYTRGPDLSGTMQGAGGIGGLLARSSGYSAGNWSTHYFYHADGKGNITYLVDSSQNLAASYRYDPFGNTISSSGTQASVNVYRFSSKEIHVNSGMYYYCYRFYDPNLQRWINRDLLAENGGLNLYGFVRNDPEDLDDTLGLAPQSGYGNPVPGIITYNPRSGVVDVGRVGLFPNPNLQALFQLSEFDPTGGSRVVLDYSLWATSATVRTPSPQLRALWEQEFNKPWPTETSGKNYDVSHIKPLGDGGDNSLKNIEPEQHDKHMARHKANGDFRRWGCRSKVPKIKK